MRDDSWMIHAKPVEGWEEFEEVVVWKAPFGHDITLYHVVVELMIALRRNHDLDQWKKLCELMRSHHNGKLTTKRLREIIWEDIAPYYPDEVARVTEKYIPKGHRDEDLYREIVIEPKHFDGSPEHIYQNTIDLLTELRAQEDPEKWYRAWHLVDSYYKGERTDTKMLQDLFHLVGPAIPTTPPIVHKIDAYVKKELANLVDEEIEKAQEDLVNHPSHYTHYIGVEVIDITEQMSFNLGNAVKYIARAGLKDPSTEIQDLEKAVWYIRRELERDDMEDDLAFRNGSNEVGTLTKQMMFRRGYAVNRICFAGIGGTNAYDYLNDAAEFIEYDIRDLKETERITRATS